MKPTAILKSRELDLTFFQIVFSCAKLRTWTPLFVILLSSLAA